MRRRTPQLALAGLLGGLLAALTACNTTPRLVAEKPVGEQQEARVDAMGVSLIAVPNAWHATPASLADHLTPLFIRIVNQGELAYDITYGTLTLIDEQGRLYAALPPMEVVRMMVGEESRPAPGPVQVAALDSDVQLAQFGIGIGSSPYDPFSGPPGYSPYAYPPDPSTAAHAILGSALREGRLLPHTQAQGFVYFQRAYQANVLTLRLEAPCEAPGAAPLLMETRFAVSR